MKKIWKFRWNVTVANMRTGANETFEYVAGWGPDKVSPDFVAQSAAAERTVETKAQYVPVSAVLVGAVA